jgi:putative tryptophan/tyrosine transport system substrate-binding protein
VHLYAKIEAVPINGLRKGLAEAGFVEGRNLTIGYAWTDGQSERLSALATELVRRDVPVIVSSALNATCAAKAPRHIRGQ